MYHLCGEQGWRQVQMHVKFLRHGGQIGKFLKFQLEWLQQQTGVGFPVLSEPAHELPHLEADFVSSVRKFLVAVGGHIEVEDPKVTPLQRDGDDYLMEIAQESGKFSKHDMKLLNYVRLHVQVELVSDTVQADGVELDAATCCGRSAVTSSTTRKYHCKQDRPNDRSWRIWRRLLGIISAKGNLKNKLGMWKWTHDKLHRNWHFYLDKGKKVLHHSQCGFIHEIEFNEASREFPQVAAIRCNCIPPQASPVTVHETDTGYRWITHGNVTLPTEVPPAHTWEDYMVTLKDCDAALFRRLQLVGDIGDIVDGLLTENLIVASDGGAACKKGSFGIVLADKQGVVLAFCNGPVTGHADSFRSESHGIVGGGKINISHQKMQRTDGVHGMGACSR